MVDNVRTILKEFRLALELVERDPLHYSQIIEEFINRNNNIYGKIVKDFYMKLLQESVFQTNNQEIVRFNYNCFYGITSDDKVFMDCIGSKKVKRNYVTNSKLATEIFKTVTQNNNIIEAVWEMAPTPKENDRILIYSKLGTFDFSVKDSKTIIDEMGSHTRITTDGNDYVTIKYNENIRIFEGHATADKILEIVKIMKAINHSNLEEAQKIYGEWCAQNFDLCFKLKFADVYGKIMGK